MSGTHHQGRRERAAHEALARRGERKTRQAASWGSDQKRAEQMKRRAFWRRRLARIDARHRPQGAHGHDCRRMRDDRSNLCVGCDLRFLRLGTRQSERFAATGLLRLKRRVLGRPLTLRWATAVQTDLARGAADIAQALRAAGKEDRRRQQRRSYPCVEANRHLEHVVQDLGRGSNRDSLAEKRTVVPLWALASRKRGEGRAWFANGNHAGAQNLRRDAKDVRELSHVTWASRSAVCDR